MICNNDMCFDDISITCEDCDISMVRESCRNGTSAIFSCSVCKKGLFIQRIKNVEMII